MRLVEILGVVVATWLLLGWRFDRAITQADGSWLGLPYTASALQAGADWTHHLYRFGVVGGSEMHGFAGTPPLLQLCAWLGVSATATANATTVFIQVAFGFFGIRLVEAVATSWSGGPIRLGAAQRIVAIWLCAFAPLLGWRLALGHENLLLGLLPLFVTVSLVWSARAGTSTATSLWFGAFVVFDAVTGLGPQTLVYSAIFGAPIVIASIAGSRWTRSHSAVAAAVVAAILVALPRLVPMIAHALGPDTSRSLSESVTYSMGSSSWRDWAGSLLCTVSGSTYDGAHEHNYPIGPLIVLLVLGWPSARSRGLRVAALASVVLAILFANNITPISTLLLDVLSPLRAFRVPARAVLPILIFVPPFALAAWHRLDLRTSARASWLAIVAGMVLLVVARGVALWPREIVAWCACLAIAVIARWRPTLRARFDLAAALGVVAALGVLAFDERFPRDAPVDTIEGGPSQLRTAVRQQAPELTTALDRVEIVDAPPPFAMSTAFAARLPSIDGIWYPPKRFLDLLSALSGEVLPATTCVFKLAHDPTFPVLQQLYNVRATIHLHDGAADFETLPVPAGGAWFPTRIALIDDGAAMTAELHDARADLHGAIQRTGWILRADRPTPPAACQHGRVASIETDELGQRATIAVEADAA